MAFQSDSIFWVEVEKIVPNPYQPRRDFDEAKLKELAESVRMYGILQPLTVTRKEIQNNDGSFKTEYELIAGERRLRASKLAGLSLVPVIIRDGEQTEQEKLELAIIENLQREDLNSVDRAIAFKQLSDVFGLSHTQVAMKVGRSREYVSNTIRLLNLPDYMLSSLRTNDITEGHARTLLMLNDRPEEQDVLFREILLKKLSVREVEKIARGIAFDKVRRKDVIDATIHDIEKKFTDALGTRVSITKTEFGGRLTIDYFSIDDLESMLERMRKEAKAEVVPAVYKDESKDTVVSDSIDEAAVTLSALVAATGLEPVPEPAPEVAPEAHATDPVNETDEPSTNGQEWEPTYEEEPHHRETVPSPTTDMTVGAISVPSEPDPVMVTPVTVTEEPSIPVVSPAASRAEVVPPVVTGTPGRQSLRDQLAMLLNKDAKPASVATPLPTTSVPAESTPSVTMTPEPAKESDDADLYSINKFTI